MEATLSAATWSEAPFANESDPSSANSTNWTTPEPASAGVSVDSTITVGASCSLIALSLVSLVVNVVLLCSFYLIRTMRPYLILNRSLVAADTFSLFFFALGLFIFTLLPIFEITADAPCVYLLIEGLRMGGILTTLCHLGALAAFHYTGIQLPLRTHVQMTKRKAHYCTVLLWTVPTTLLLAYIFLLEGDGFNVCPYHFIMYVKFRTIFCVPFFTILGMMIIVYVHIYKAVHVQQMTGANNRSNQERSAKKYLMTSLIILGSTLVGWLPAFAYFALVCKDCLLSAYFQRHTVNDFILIYIINFLLIFKTATNCLIYAMRIKEIEKPLKKMGCGFLLKWCGNTAGRNADIDRTRSSMKSSRLSFTRKPTLVRLQSSNNEVHMNVVGKVNKDRSYSRIRRHHPTNTSV